jgi:F0F1-type ATP synthase membrane subunit b/b'
MSADSPTEVIDQHFTDPAPDRSTEELIWASEKLIEKYGSASKVAEETKASSHSINMWNRLGRLPDDILGYVYMGELSPSSADIIRRLDSDNDRRLVSMVTIEESLPEKYIKLLQKQISNEGKGAQEAIKSVVGETTVLRSVTLGFDEDTHIELWAEAGRRQCSVAELCEKLIHERIEQITGANQAIENRSETVQEQTNKAQENATELIENLEELNQSVAELREEIDHG